MKLSKHERRDRKRTAKEAYRRKTGRMGVTDRHHIVNRSHHGDSSRHNLLTMDINRHRAWHLLFGNASFLDVIYILIRCLRMKQHPDFEEANNLMERKNDTPRNAGSLLEFD